MKILIIDDMHPSIIPMLQELGYEVTYNPDITEKEVYNIISSYTGLILRSKIFIGTEILQKAINLKFIGRAGAGMDQIVENDVRMRNIKLINAPEGNRDALAEHAIGMLLCMFNKINTADREIRNGIWKREENRGYELGGKTVAIIGYGNNGKAFARKVKGFDCQVLTYDILDRNYSDDNARSATMGEIFDQADIVSFHVPLTEKTHKMVNSSYLQQFKKNIWLINTSRGQVVVLKDLLARIDTGKVRGACLDVLEIENLEKFKHQESNTYNQLMNHPRVLLSPHVAGWTFESYEKINQVLVDKIRNLHI